MASSERRPRRRRKLRTGFLLVVLAGVVLPLGLVGLWLAGTTQRSAETVVRARLAGTLADMVPGVGERWAVHRSRLLELGDAPALRDALAGGRELRLPAVAEAGEDASLADLRARWAALDGVVGRLEVSALDGGRVAVLERSAAAGAGAGLATALVPVRLSLSSRTGASDVGSLEAWIFAGALLPGDLLLPGVSGSVLALFEPAGGSPLLPLPMDPNLLGRGGFEWGGESWAVARRRLYEPPLVLALAGPVGAVAEPFQDATRTGTLALLIVAAFAVGLTVLVSRRLTRPLDRLAEAAADVTGGRLDRRVPGDGPDEVQRLAAAFNEMTASLRGTLQRLAQQEALAAMGEIAASMAHEVRNPLTAIRLDLDRTRRRLRGDAEAERLLERAMRQVERLDHSVDGALRLARSGRIDVRRIELAGPIHAAAAAAAPRIAARQAVLDVPADTGAGIHAEADPDALEQLLLNLLLNAADALPPGGTAAVAVEQRPAELCIIVSDDGTGMDPEIRRRVFEPFFSTRREGTGLGLSIARRIATTHGGALEIESEPGRGTRVTLVLPRNVTAAAAGVSADDTPGALQAAGKLPQPVDSQGYADSARAGHGSG
jgi:signal transduction histidine kinase/uncharacterized membrane protein